MAQRNRPICLLAAVCSLLCLPEAASAVELDLGTWTAIGDAAPGGGNATVTTARFDATDNASGGNPELTDAQGGTLESQLGFADEAFAQLSDGGASIDAFEGSGVRNSSLLARAGDVFRFDWTFRTDDDERSTPADGTGDYAFVVVRDPLDNPLLNLNPDMPLVGVTDPLAPLSGSFARGTSGSFAFSFPSSGQFDVAIGVVDIFDPDLSSEFVVTNARQESIPFGMTPGLGLSVLCGIFGLRQLGRQVLRR